MRTEKTRTRLETTLGDIRPTTGDEISVIGFRMNSSEFTKNLFVIIVSNSADVPLMINDRIIFFTNFNQIKRFYDFYGEVLNKIGLLPTEPVFICDTRKILDIIRNKDRDNTASILNLLNTLFDLIQALNLKIPLEYKEPLFKFADHLTFDRNFSRFLKKQSISRETIIDAIVWCIGRVALNAEVWGTRLERGGMLKFK